MGAIAVALRTAARLSVFVTGEQSKERLTGGSKLGPRAMLWPLCLCNHPECASRAQHARRSNVAAAPSG